MQPVILHPAAGPMIVLAAPSSMLLGTLLVLLRDGPALNILALAGGLAGSFAAVVVWSVVACRLLPIELSEEGVRGYDFWCRRWSILWQDIHSVRPYRLMNLRYLRLYGPSGSSVLWLPTFFPKSAAFRETVARLAPKNSPVLDHL